MAASSAEKSNPLAHGAKITLPSDREIVITRELDAPPALVFEAWTKPEHIAQWWDPSGRPLAACEIDLRSGGTFRFVHQGAGGPGHAFAGTYKEIARPHRLVFATRSPSGGETVGTLVFTEHAGRTALTLTMLCASKSDRDALLSMRVDVGTAQTLENLARYLKAAG
jgi:uncharacterized protein YndB with AHSA1/START domain